MKKILLASIALVFAGILFLAPDKAFAGASHNMTGWAWSGTIGWISFNNLTDGSGVDYGVNKNPDGTLVGYAWSDAIGWIQFGGLSGFPSGTGTYSQNAQVVGSTVRGWARALSNGSGWDGWISLSGSSPAYGVSNSGTAFTGYAWGGDVVGWVLFDVQNVYPAICADCGVKLSGDATLDVKNGGVSLSGNPAVPYGTIPTFEWTLTNIPSATCSVTKTAGGTAFSTISGITSSGSSVGNALTSQGLHTYSLDCTNPTISKQISFTVAAQPPGFSLGGTEIVPIQVLSSGTADSNQENIFVSTSGGFNNTVTISITGFPTPPASTTFQYSLNGGSSYASNPGSVMISSPYSTGVGFKFRVIRQSGAPEFDDQYTVTLTGVGSGAPNATKDLIIDPALIVPIYEEN